MGENIFWLLNSCIFQAWEKQKQDTFINFWGVFKIPDTENSNVKNNISGYWYLQ